MEASSSRNNLAGSSSLFDFEHESAPEPELSSTQRDNSEGEIAGGSTENSASPQRRRSPSVSSEDEDEDDEAPLPESHPTDAFARMMAADQRPLTKHQKQAKARISSNLVDEQADESDEDNWLMPGQKNEEEEEDDGDDDAFLPDLVNDEDISEEDRMRQDALVAQKNRSVPFILTSICSDSAGRYNSPMMPSERLKLVKSQRGNTELNAVAKISTQTMKMEHRERRGGPRNRCDRERSGRRMGLINLVRQLCIRYRIRN